jgi:hypothetical protein
MSDDAKSNRSKGRDSFDAQVGTSLVEFFNKNVTPYPTDVGAPAFDLVPVGSAKRHHAQCGPLACPARV